MIIRAGSRTAPCGKESQAFVGGVSGADAGQTQRALRSVPAAVEVPRCDGKLSVQVHPSDADKELLPAGETGKTEAWVVLEAGPEARIFAGLKAFTRAATLRQAIRKRTVADQLASFTPNPGDAVLIPAGTVHSLSDVVVFEVQQNSDVTFRLYDWGHLDPRTGQRRALQVDQAMACIDFRQGAIGPITAGVGADEAGPAREARAVRSIRRDPNHRRHPV